MTRPPNDRNATDRAGRRKVKGHVGAFRYWTDILGLQSVLFALLTVVCFVILLVVTYVMF